MMEPMNGTSSSMALDVPSWSSRNSSLLNYTVPESNELIMEDNNSVSLGSLKAGEHPRPFASFGSFQQRLGNIHQDMKYNPSGVAMGKRGKSIEALGQNVCNNDYFQKDPEFTEKSAKPIEIDFANSRKLTKGSSSRHQKDLSKMKSRLNNVDLEEAWERRKFLHRSKDTRTTYTLDDNEEMGRAVGRSVSDCGDRKSTSSARLSSKRSLTDDDLEELRGCIDLGFAFYNDEAERKLWTTLPALELCYAISKQFKGIETILAPSTNLPSESSSPDGLCSPCSSPLPSWRISSPGDHPQQVKARLKHWAQAVAFTVKQNVEPRPSVD